MFPIYMDPSDWLIFFRSCIVVCRGVNISKVVPDWWIIIKRLNHVESLVTMDQHGLKLGWIIHNNITMKLQISSVYSQIQAQENGFLLRNDKLLRNNSYCVRNIFCTNRPEGGRESSKNNSENGKPIFSSVFWLVSRIYQSGDVGKAGWPFLLLFLEFSWPLLTCSYYNYSL